MKKIPTVFERDWNGDRSRVVNQVHTGCEWVIRGEGVATQKLDGTCAMIREGKLYKRREVKKNTAAPAGFELVETDPKTGDSVGWVQIGDGPDDQWFREAFPADHFLPDGTYELLGPKVQGNPEGLAKHVLQAHATAKVFLDAPRTFDELKEWLATKDMEGVVFHHPDGRMAKIKLRDFG